MKKRKDPLSMALHLDKFDVMEYLWDTLEKTADGRHIRYTQKDIDQLWGMGFVDTKRVDMLRWRALFESMRQPDGSYLISRDQFMALDEYRYKGEIRIPFDAMLINEGKYTDEGLDDLINASISPSCVLPMAEIMKFFDKLRKQFREPDGLILIKKPAKQQIQQLLKKYPSPLRNLELLLHQMLKSRGEQIHDAVQRSEIDAVTAKAAMQVSSFSGRPATRTEEKAMGLKALQKTKKKTEEVEVEGKAKTELKKIRRSTRGMRG